MHMPSILSRLIRYALLGALPVLSACSNLGYYSHLARGQYELMSARVPIRDVVNDEKQDPEDDGQHVKALPDCRVTSGARTSRVGSSM